MLEKGPRIADSQGRPIRTHASSVLNSSWTRISHNAENLVDPINSTIVSATIEQGDRADTATFLPKCKAAAKFLRRTGKKTKTLDIATQKDSHKAGPIKGPTCAGTWESPPETQGAGKLPAGSPGLQWWKKSLRTSVSKCRSETSILITMTDYQGQSSSVTASWLIR